MRELANLLHEAWEGEEMEDSDLPVVEYLPGRLGRYQRFAEGMRDFTLTPAFTNTITATILVAGVLVGLQVRAARRRARGDGRGRALSRVARR